jgi:hypothetical protein
LKPLAIDICCGLGGWTRGLMAAGYDCIGFDIERHAYDGEYYPAQLVLQDILTLHGSQFCDVDLIVASPPCQFFSYTAMPWSRAKVLAAEVRASPERLEKELALFNACFRIQREASDAAGRHIPMVVENVRGAQPWVGPARFNAGSMYFWGDVPALMPADKHIKVQSFRFDGSGRSFQTAAVKEHAEAGGFRPTSLAWGNESRWFNDGPRSPDSYSSSSSSSPRRKAASARIAMIPHALAYWIGRAHLPKAA